MRFKASIPIVFVAFAAISLLTSANGATPHHKPGISLPLWLNGEWEIEFSSPDSDRGAGGTWYFAVADGKLIVSRRIDQQNNESARNISFDGTILKFALGDTLYDIHVVSHTCLSGTQDKSAMLKSGEAFMGPGGPNNGILNIELRRSGTQMFCGNHTGWR